MIIIGTGIHEESVFIVFLDEIVRSQRLGHDGVEIIRVDVEDSCCRSVSDHR